jgi:hypothetical protein
LAAELYNSNDFSPYTFIYPTLHADFADNIILWGNEALTVTPQKLKQKWSDVHGKLVIIVSNYDASGNGAGNRDQNDPDHGNVSEFTLVDNMECQNFLGGNPSHLLYFWQLLEEHDLLKNTLSVIPTEI